MINVPTDKVCPSAMETSGTSGSHLSLISLKYISWVMSNKKNKQPVFKQIVRGYEDEVGL